MAVGGHTEWPIRLQGGRVPPCATMEAPPLSAARGDKGQVVSIHKKVDQSVTNHTSSSTVIQSLGQLIHIQVE